MCYCKILGKFAPYLLVPFFAGIITFLTWITMTVAGAGADVVELTAILVCLATASLLTWYVVHCTTRNRCADQQAS